MMTFRSNLIRASVTFVMVFAFVWKGSADTARTPDKTPDKAKSATNDKGSAEESEPSGKSATSPTRRDPFLVPAKLIRPPKIVKPVVVKPEPKPLPPPSIDDRMTDYKKLVRDYYEGRSVEPGKLAPYLIDELAVTGIFQNQGGYGAFVAESATQKQQTFFARAGWKTFDGYIKEILPTGVKFVKIVRLDNGTVRQVEEFRALPAPNAK